MQHRSLTYSFQLHLRNGRYFYQTQLIGNSLELHVRSKSYSFVTLSLIFYSEWTRGDKYAVS